jgi:hypothetical protein
MRNRTGSLDESVTDSTWSSLTGLRRQQTSAHWRRVHDYTSLILKYKEPNIVISKYLEEDHKLHACESKDKSFHLADCLARLRNGYDVFKYSYFKT